MRSLSIEEKVEALESDCRREGYNYALFCGFSDEQLLGTASLSLQQIGIITETLCANLTRNEMEFITALVSKIEAEKLS